MGYNWFGAFFGIFAGNVVVFLNWFFFGQSRYTIKSLICFLVMADILLLVITFYNGCRR